MRFKKPDISSGQYKCPFCGDDHIVKNGKFKGNQRYLCRNCRKSFSQQTQTPTAYSKKKTKVWIDYIECMIKGYSLRRCAWECNLNLATAFFLATLKFRCSELIYGDRRS